MSHLGNQGNVMPHIKLNEVLPVFISIAVLILVAIIQRQSKAIAAVTATMPVTIPLTLWIVYSSTHGDQVSMQVFTRSMVNGIIPTVAFVFAVWLGSRAGLKIVPLIALGYSTWAVTLVFMLALRRLINF
jgi:hypothetical protein